LCYLFGDDSKCAQFNEAVADEEKHAVIKQALAVLKHANGNSQIKTLLMTKLADSVTYIRPHPAE